MAIKYRVATKPKNPNQKPKWSAAMNKGPSLTLGYGRLALHTGEGFEIRERTQNQPFGPTRTLRDSRAALSHRMDVGDVGEFWVVRAVKDGYSQFFRKVKVADPVMDTPGNGRIDLIHSALFARFPSLESWGICNCRHIAGSTIWSQHSWCNAEDVHASVATMDAAASWLESKRGELPIGTVLWRVRDHFDHIHYEADPKMTGVPPCAQ